METTLTKRWIMNDRKIWSYQCQQLDTYYIWYYSLWFSSTKRTLTINKDFAHCNGLKRCQRDLIGWPVITAGHNKCSLSRNGSDDSSTQVFYTGVNLKNSQDSEDNRFWVSLQQLVVRGKQSLWTSNSITLEIYGKKIISANLVTWVPSKAKFVVFWATKTTWLM